MKFSLSQRVQFLAAVNPFVQSDTEPANGTGDLSLGIQGILYHGEGARPTIALSYARQTFSGGTPDLDIGSPTDSAGFLASADVLGFHYDANCFLNHVRNEYQNHRLQFGEALSVSHRIVNRLGITGEIWHFTQPFQKGNTVGNLWAVNYNAGKNLVLDVGFNRGLTRTSTRWEIVAGFTYVLPRAL
ncbi:MAG TPA: hypothetical protein VFB00_00210, partial [Terriglobales bacterium]|nr:hypothetical protein [Terriglobales bacterium]